MAPKTAGFTLLELLIVIAIVGIISTLIYDQNYKVASTITLKSDEWQCLQTEERDYTYSIFMGKMSVERNGRRNECIEYKRRG